jgi:hypothetical protein
MSPSDLIFSPSSATKDSFSYESGGSNVESAISSTLERDDESSIVHESSIWSEGLKVGWYLSFLVSGDFVLDVPNPAMIKKSELAVCNLNFGAKYYLIERY